MGFYVNQKPAIILVIIIDIRNNSGELSSIDIQQSTKKQFTWERIIFPTNGSTGEQHAKNETGPLPHTIYKN